jgi:hypothetical protein
MAATKAGKAAAVQALLACGADAWRGDNSGAQAGFERRCWGGTQGWRACTACAPAASHAALLPSRAGATALHHAAWEGQGACLCVLLAHAEATELRAARGGGGGGGARAPAAGGTAGAGGLDGSSSVGQRTRCARARVHAACTGVRVARGARWWQAPREGASGVAAGGDAPCARTGTCVLRATPPPLQPIVRASTAGWWT